MDVLIGFVLALVVVASAAAGYRLSSGPRRVLSPEGRAGQAALHAAAATLPHLRNGLGVASATHVLVDAPALAICDTERVLAFDGAGADHHLPGEHEIAGLPALAPDRLVVEPHLGCVIAGCPLSAAIVAPIVVGELVVGALMAFYPSGGRVRPEDTRVVQECAALVGAQVALAELEAQSERLAEAELRALRAQISPHFIYNALAAIAAHIHSDPDEARELLTDFAEFTRYAFRGQRPYVTVADELTYVEKYLRLEQARFGERLTVRVEVAPEVLQAVVPVLSLQPLVENALKHGLAPGHPDQSIEVHVKRAGGILEIIVEDNGKGLDGLLTTSGRFLAAAPCVDGLGIGLTNTRMRLTMLYGDRYAFRMSNQLSGGCRVEIRIPVDDR